MRIERLHDYIDTEDLTGNVQQRSSQRHTRHAATSDDGTSPHRVIKHSSKDTTLAPEEVLFGRIGAPARFAEHDIYFANERDLPDGGQRALPASDLLQAIHPYASRFYGAMGRRPGAATHGGSWLDERSMDETALLAFGILIEEAGKEVLGRQGDMVFTEAAQSDNDDEVDGMGNPRHGRRPIRPAGRDGPSDSSRRPPNKRPRTTVKLGDEET